MILCEVSKLAHPLWMCMFPMISCRTSICNIVGVETYVLCFKMFMKCLCYTHYRQKKLHIMGKECVIKRTISIDQTC